MGNCFTKKKNKKHFAEITPSYDNLSTKKPHVIPLVFLSGDPTNLTTTYIRFALLLKPITLHFTPSETTPYALRFDTEGNAVRGNAETVLRFVESRVPDPPLFRRGREGEVVVRMAELQHRSMTWHVERVVRWGKDIAARGGEVSGEPGVGTAKMEVGKLGKSYGMLLEVLLEHAQMEERVLFPILQAADPGVCRCVNEEHARDLPLLNGIKEDIKSIGVINTGTPTHREALYSACARLETLLDNCREHFKEEERNLFPLMEAADLTRERQRKVVEQCVDVMQETHSRFFRFFVEGLLPHEAMEYLDLIMNCLEKESVSSMLRLLVD